ncbi:hypothetical protein [Microbacterium sp. cx-59]|uniref:hypothetical protein n=1 Tax=Microbacterium sp. cx-59 TaxID=2891207 RepID=UPI001E42CE2F|nr:hypothetical protein [Microbacterium sp. cx-59]MCC4909361.1 hypothetical protein [Microbacterium sp. cx-59]
MTRRHAASGAIALLAVALVLTACNAQPRPAPSATALPSGVTATLLPATPAQTADEARVWIVNSTAADLALTRLRIDAPVFEGIGRKADGGAIEVAAGKSAEIVITLPAINCNADRPASAIPTTDATPEPTGTPDAAATPAATPAPTAAPDQTTATIGFALGAAIGVAVEELDDPEGVIAARTAAACD